MVEIKEVLSIDILFPRLTFVLTAVKYKYVQKFMKSLLVFWTTNLLIQIYYFLKIFNFECLLQYGPVAFFSCLTLISLLGVSTCHYTWIPLYQVCRTHLLIEINTATAKLKGNTLLAANELERFFLISLILHFVSAATYIIPIIRNPAFFSVIVLLTKTYVPELLVPIITIYLLTCLILVFILCCAAYYPILSFVLLKIQFIFLNEHIIYLLKRKITIPENDYNNYVQKQLKFVIEWHQKVTELHLNINNMAVSYFLCIGGAVISVVFFLIFTAFSPYYGITQVIPLFVNLIWTIYLVSYVGQGYEDWGEKILYTLYDLEWYTWNDKNRKMFTILFINMSKTLNVGYMSLRMNHDLFKRAIRLLYTFGNIMYSFLSK